MAIKSGRGIVWKVIMKVEAVGLRGSGHNSYLVAQLIALATSNTTMVHLAVFSANRNFVTTNGCVPFVCIMCSTCGVHALSKQ